MFGRRTRLRRAKESRSPSTDSSLDLINPAGPLFQAAVMQPMLNNPVDTSPPSVDVSPSISVDTGGGGGGGW